MTKSRTIWVAAIIAMLGFIEASTDVFRPMLTDLLSDRACGWVIFGIGLIMAGMRTITTEPMSKRTIRRKSKAKTA